MVISNDKNRQIRT